MPCRYNVHDRTIVVNFNYINLLLLYYISLISRLPLIAAFPKVLTQTKTARYCRRIVGTSPSAPGHFRLDSDSWWLLHRRSGRHLFLAIARDRKFAPDVFASPAIDSRLPIDSLGHNSFRRPYVCMYWYSNPNVLTPSTPECLFWDLPCPEGAF